ncbi:MAG: porin family protein [Siculibacillus sp.]|nr:porin family protein [Siculibacillus sp.]
MTNTFLRAALGCVALVAVSGAAQAADMYRKAPPATPIETPVSVYNWTGFYAGANLGGEFMRDRATVGAVRGSLNSGSLFGGVQAGYNWQTGPWVLGVEGDIGYGRPSKTGLFGATTVKAEEGVNGTLRARVGHAFDRTLVYGTGGLAVANFSTTATNVGGTQKIDSTRVGYAVGAGIEHAVTNNISVKGEYLYEGFGSSRNTFAVPAVTTRQSLSDHIVRVGVNYKF